MHSIPHSIASDQGTQFSGKKIVTWGSYHGIHWSHHVSHHSGVAGLIESEVACGRLSYSSVWENNLQVRVLVNKMPHML